MTSCLQFDREPQQCLLMSDTPPNVVLIGGPNGAGKSTLAETVIGEYLGIREFVNADVIAKGLSGFDPDAAALQAGRIMLTRLRELAAERASFAFESTLASRTFAPWLRELIASGYQFDLIHSWLSSGALAVSRVKRRVRKGGHSVPEETILRRYGRSVANFVNMYMPIASRWRVYDNSSDRLQVVAAGGTGIPVEVYRQATWNRLLEIASAQGHDEHR
jgi:predicted ABC-type ATPase